MAISGRAAGGRTPAKARPRPTRARLTPPRCCCRRLVYLDGVRHRVPTAHSAVLCFMAGPLGLASHLATKWAVQWRRRRAGEGAAGAAPA
jgi:hypothetical protein